MKRAQHQPRLALGNNILYSTMILHIPHRRCDVPVSTRDADSSLCQTCCLYSYSCVLVLRSRFQPTAVPLRGPSGLELKVGVEGGVLDVTCRRLRVSRGSSTTFFKASRGKAQGPTVLVVFCAMALPYRACRYDPKRAFRVHVLRNTASLASPSYLCVCQLPVPIHIMLRLEEDPGYILCDCSRTSTSWESYEELFWVLSMRFDAIALLSHGSRSPGSVDRMTPSLANYATGDCSSSADRSIRLVTRVDSGARVTMSFGGFVFVL